MLCRPLSRRCRSGPNRSNRALPRPETHGRGIAQVMRKRRGVFSALKRPGLKRNPPLLADEWLGLMDATSNDGRGGCCAKAVQHGATEPANIKPHNATASAATPVPDARRENVRMQRSSISMPSPGRDLPHKVPAASGSLVFPKSKRPIANRPQIANLPHNSVRIAFPA